MTMILMNFSGVYESQEFWKAEQDALFLDLKAVSGTNGYCSGEAAMAIRDAIHDLPAESVHFLDSGNYHYLSLFWMEKIREPYDLVVFDHHTDMQPSAWGDELISCGAWIRHALLHDRNLKDVWIAGSQQDAFLEAVSQPDLLPHADRIRLAAPGNLIAAMRGAADRPVYLSVDKDVLSKADLDTNWDQGELEAEELLHTLEGICREKTVIGADVCGEPDHQAGAGKILQSDRVNRSVFSCISRFL